MPHRLTHKDPLPTEGRTTSKYEVAFTGVLLAWLPRSQTVLKCRTPAYSADMSVPAVQFVQ